MIPVSDYIDLPSNGIITNDKTIKEQPELVQALVTATLHGLADTLADPDAAFDISLKAVPEAGGDAGQGQPGHLRRVAASSGRLTPAELGHSIRPPGPPPPSS